MTIRNWVIFFFKGLLIGGAVTGVLSLFIQWEDAFAPYVASGEYLEFAASFLWFVFLGMTMSVLSQMGFFAYLTVHQFGVNIFRTLTLWNWVQLLIIALVIFDLIKFRFMPLAETQSQLLLYLGLLTVLLVTGLVVAYFKAKWTKKHAFISALFFMIVITTLEWLPVLMVDEKDVDRYGNISVPIISCECIQLLKLPKYNAKSDADPFLKLEERRKARAEADVIQSAVHSIGRHDLSFQSRDSDGKVMALMINLERLTHLMIWRTVSPKNNMASELMILENEQELFGVKQRIQYLLSEL